MSLPEPSPPIPVSSAAMADGGAEESGSPNWGTASRGRTPPLNGRPKARTFEGVLPLKFCAFDCWPSRPIGELADERGGMAADFQSDTDPLDRR